MRRCQQPRRHAAHVTTDPPIAAAGVFLKVANYPDNHRAGLVNPQAYEGRLRDRPSGSGGRHERRKKVFRLEAAWPLSIRS